MNDILPTEIRGHSVHDLGDARIWGNDFSVLDSWFRGQKLSLVVYRSTRIRRGDYLAIPRSREDETRALYQVAEVDTPTDPGDQHFIMAEHRKWVDVQ